MKDNKRNFVFRGSEGKLTGVDYDQFFQIYYGDELVYEVNRGTIGLGWREKFCEDDECIVMFEDGKACVSDSAGVVYRVGDRVAPHEHVSPEWATLEQTVIGFTLPNALTSNVVKEMAVITTQGAYYLWELRKLPAAGLDYNEV